MGVQFGTMRVNTYIGLGRLRQKNRSFLTLFTFIVLFIQPVLNDGGEFVSLSTEAKFEDDGVTAEYIVKGIAIGHTSLAFTGTCSFITIWLLYPI